LYWDRSGHRLVTNDDGRAITDSDGRASRMAVTYEKPDGAGLDNTRKQRII